MQAQSVAAFLKGFLCAFAREIFSAGCNHRYSSMDQRLRSELP
jgi:hypothetical protein